MRIKLGSEAPDFEASSQMLDGLRLSDLRGKRNVALVFLRYLGCPLCQMDLMDLSRAYETLMEAGIEPIVFVESTAARVKRFAARSPVPYHLVGDPERSVYDLYGLEEGGVGAVLSPAVLRKSLKATLAGHMHGRFEGTEKRLPGGFVVDSTGHVILAHYGRNVSDSLTVDRILTAVPSLF